jgi:MFS transporter, PPP family, 3-phenylpropionic acid transporter
MPEIAAIRIVYFATFCCTGAWLPKLYDYCVYKGLSGTQSALVLSITPIMMFLVQPLYGIMADKMGYKKTLLTAAFLAAMAYGCYVYANSFSAIVMITLFMSVFYNTIQPVLDSMALQAAAANPKFSYGTLRVFGAAGFACTAIITGQVIDAVNITVIFWVSAISMLLVFGFAFFLHDKKVTSTNSNAYGNIWTVVKNRSLLFLLFCVFAVSACATTIWNFYSAYMKENGASDTLVGYGLSFQGLCELPVFYFSARLLLRWGIKATLIVTVLASAIRMLLYSITHNPVAALPIELLHGFSWSLFWVVCVEYVNKLVDNQWQATGQSLLYAAYFGAGAIAGNFWTDFLLSGGMMVAEIFLINAALVFMVAILILVFQKRKSASLQA